LIAAAGFDGVDCPVRPKDEVLPERVKDDLPRYAELLQKRGRKLSLLTTAITSPESPHTQDILETARKLGVRHYRLGFMRAPQGAAVPKLVEETRAHLKALAAMNQELDLCALLQNHSPSGRDGYLGGDLDVMVELLQGFDPRQVAVAFDLGHALLVHGDDWPARFAKLQPHLGVVYVKDTHRQRRFVPFGEGEFKQTNFFSRLKGMNYSAPISLHIEYDWHDGGKARTQAALLQAATACNRTLRTWLAAA
jgi:L-ribulose-5-phosphate 3-epimerase